MPIRFSHTPPNFPLAFLLSPIAGAIAGSGAAIIWSLATSASGEGERIAGALTFAMLSGVYAFGISMVYTAMAGALVALSVLRSGVVPSRGFAIAVGLVVGFLPFVGLTLLMVSDSSPDRLSEDLRVVTLVPSVALAASVATAWTFWSLGLKGRAGRASGSA